MKTTKRMVLQAIAFVAAGVWRIAPARADAADKAALAVADRWYLPRVDALASAFAAQETAWAEGCSGAADLARLREAFHAASDAWIAIEHAGFGPLGRAERADRIAFFPDRRNAIGKAVAGLLSRARTGPLAAADVAGITVAGQGLPALERLLYDPALETAFAADPAQARARCTVGLAIAGNLSDIADAVKAEWLAPDGPRARLAAGEGSPPAFADGRQALSQMLTDLATGLQRLADVKIRRFLGTSLDTAAPALAEGLRATRVKRNLALAAQSLADEAIALAAAGTSDLVQARIVRIADRFAGRYAAAPEDVALLAADPQRRGEVLDLVAPLRAMQTAMSVELAPALGVQLGFNALDGD